MADYQNMTSVDVAPEELFDFLADVRNLPRYFPLMTSAARAGDGNAVQTQAEFPDGEVVEGEAWFDVDRAAGRIRWGSEGPRDYHGHLTVTGSDGGAQVHVVVSTARVESDDVQRGVDDTMANIKELFEGRRALDTR